jgi:hypothetical protein
MRRDVTTSPFQEGIFRTKHPNKPTSNVSHHLSFTKGSRPSFKSQPRSPLMNANYVPIEKRPADGFETMRTRQKKSDEHGTTTDKDYRLRELFSLRPFSLRNPPRPFVGRDSSFVLQRQADVIQSVKKTVAAEVVDLERDF